MSALLKDLYSRPFYENLTDGLTTVLPAFNKKKFLNRIFIPEFIDMELKQRMRHTTHTLHEFLPVEYPKAAKIIQKLIVVLRRTKYGDNKLQNIFFPDYVEIYGLDHFDESVKALEFITRFITCEYAVRPFILKYKERMINQMTAWSMHQDASVRRLASEGIRPRLPWSIALPALKKDPTPIMTILEALKNDPNESVRRSVANNLNDISRDNPEFVFRLARKWKGASKETDGIIRHGCRTLLKNAHPGILEMYGLKSAQVELSNLVVYTPEIRIGDSLEFSFSILNKSRKSQMIRVEYAISYLRKKGQLTRKIFKISERNYLPAEHCQIRRKQKFVLITTRTFYAGGHQVSVIINGKEMAAGTFNLAF